MNEMERCWRSAFVFYLAGLLLMVQAAFSMVAIDLSWNGDGSSFMSMGGEGSNMGGIFGLLALIMFFGARLSRGGGLTPPIWGLLWGIISFHMMVLIHYFDGAFLWQIPDQSIMLFLPGFVAGLVGILAGIIALFDYKFSQAVKGEGVKSVKAGDIRRLMKKIKSHNASLMKKKKRESKVPLDLKFDEY